VYNRYVDRLLGTSEQKNLTQMPNNAHSSRISSRSRPNRYSATGNSKFKIHKDGYD